MIGSISCPVHWPPYTIPLLSADHLFIAVFRSGARKSIERKVSWRPSSSRSANRLYTMTFLKVSQSTTYTTTTNPSARSPSVVCRRLSTPYVFLLQTNYIRPSSLVTLSAVWNRLLSWTTHIQGQLPTRRRRYVKGWRRRPMRKTSAWKKAWRKGMAPVTASECVRFGVGMYLLCDS